jgi:hypothetical protein
VTAASSVRVILLMGAAALLAGCTSPGGLDSGAGGEAPSSPASWAEDFELAYEQATTEEEREALRDGEITAQEYAYFQQRIVDCLVSRGMTAKFRADGALEYTNPGGVSQEVIDRCNWENGLRLIVLRDSIERNPAHLDETSIMLDCLKRVGLVPADYTEAELLNGVGLKEIEATEDFAACAADPLHHDAH